MHAPIDGTYYCSDESDDDMLMVDIIVPNNDH
jgi:hypothetical protein